MTAGSLMLLLAAAVRRPRRKAGVQTNNFAVDNACLADDSDGDGDDWTGFGRTYGE